ncbi:uncharacterized protein LOC122031197 [Zingiber officinale]|uniref:uncharacterized protein LOC122031197 n=1 Tax=Zingiber officinale TaxID=94328 RepID=UPI001C4DA404|nr:uncharacterized protein LOC122031197 [Zingiber officinale]
MGRTPCCDRDDLKKGPWTPEEDQKLVVCVQKHGQGNWRTLPKNAGLARCGKSCRLRWTNYLRPDIKRGMRRGRSAVGSHRGPGRPRKQPIEAEEPEPVTQEADSSRDPIDVEMTQGIPSVIPSGVPALATTDWMRDRACIPLLARSVKDRVTLYSGGADPWAARSWLRNLESTFGYMSCTDEEKVELVAYHL